MVGKHFGSGLVRFPGIDSRYGRFKHGCVTVAFRVGDFFVVGEDIRKVLFKGLTEVKSKDGITLRSG